MRALVVCAAPASGYEAHVLELAASVDLVLAADGGARLCLAAGVAPDVVVGDQDSLDSATRDALRATQTRLVSYPADKDQTDLDLALEEARRLHAGEVAVCAAFTGRLDHTLAAVGALARAADLHPQISEPGLHGWLLDSNHRAELAIVQSGATFSVVPVVGDAVVSVSGARWLLDRSRLDALGSRGVSNRVVAERSVVRVHAGAVLVTVSELRVPCP